jgi:hypothetical protein
MCCRFWYRDLPRKADRREEQDVLPEPDGREQLQSERLKEETKQIKTVNGYKVNGYNEILKEAFEVIREANRKGASISRPDNEEDVIPISGRRPGNDWVFDSGTMPDEFEAMVQVMKGCPVSDEVQRQAVQAMRKTEGTEIYSHLLGSISGAQERVREALNGMEQADSGNSDSSGNFDIMRYVRV